MNVPDSSQEGPNPLSRLLSEWHVTDPLPARFQEQVWQKITRSETNSLRPWLGLGRFWLQRWLDRPFVTGACAAAFLVAGPVAGYWQARSDAREMDRRLEIRYLQAINPYDARSR